jgi:KaiC/GvpD/RAD55 family RecA-like ATPase
VLDNKKISGDLRDNIPYAIVALGGKEVVPELFNMLRNESHLFVACSIAQAILGLHDKDSALKLVSMLQEEEIDVDKKCYIADAFKHFEVSKVNGGGEEVVTALEKMRADAQTNRFLRVRINDALRRCKISVPRKLRL